MKIKDIKKITDHRYVNLFSVRYRDQASQEKNWVYASRSPVPGDQNEPDAVVVVPFHTGENKLVIIREFRVVLGGYQYGFPAGLVDPGESVEAAGKRELFEETGLHLTRTLACSPAVYSSSGLTDESVSLLYAECEGLPSTDHTEASEDIEVLMLSREGAGDLLAEPGVKFDVKTWIVLNTFAVHGMI